MKPYTNIANSSLKCNTYKNNERWIEKEVSCDKIAKNGVNRTPMTLSSGHS